jgi:hypothetical protein
MRLAGLEAAKGGLADAPDRELRLRKALSAFSKQYDVVIIDCSPSIGLLTYNALVAAEMVVIPVETGFFSLQGATRQAGTVRTLAKRLGVSPAIWMLATMHDAGNAIATDLLDELHRRFKGRVAPLVIRRDARLREAASFGQPIADYAPLSEGAEDYKRLAAWLIERLESRLDTRTDSGDHDVDAHDAGPGALGGEVTTTQRWGTSGAPVGASVRTDVGTDVGTSENAGWGTLPGSANAGSHAASPDAMPAEVTAALVAAGIDEPTGTRGHAEPKPMSRAEDVAKRAQEFLRKLAMGRGSALAAAPAVSQDAVEPHAPERTTSGGGTAVYLEPSTARTASISPSTRRLLGVRQTNQGCLFVQPIGSVKAASIAGTFNDWSATAHPMRRNEELGVYELCLRLPPGRYLYRVVLDGAWSADPNNESCEPNPYGEVNSVLVVPSGPGSA